MTADRDWSELIEKVTSRIRRAGGDFVPVEPVLPVAGAFDPQGGLWGRYNRGLAAAVMAAASDDGINAVYPPRLLVGLHDGVFAGIEGDVQGLQWLRQAPTTNPVEMARAILDVGHELAHALPTSFSAARAK